MGGREAREATRRTPSGFMPLTAAAASGRVRLSTLGIMNRLDGSNRRYVGGIRRVRVCCARDLRGNGRLARCHASGYEKWSHARHGKMLQPAAPSSVKGDFTRGQVSLRGRTYGLRKQNGAYCVAESYLTGKEQEHRIDYTLGSRRVQHYFDAPLRRPHRGVAA